MFKWIITLLLILCGSLAYAVSVEYKENQLLKKEISQISTQFNEYKKNNNSIKQLEVNLIKALKNEHNKENAFRHAVDSGLVELRVKVDSLERDSAAAGDTIEHTARLAASVRQDYYCLRKGICWSKKIIEYWQKYYCLEIAPKNKTEFMCK